MSVSVRPFIVYGVLPESLIDFKWRRTRFGSAVVHVTDDLVLDTE